MTQKVRAFTDLARAANAARKHLSPILDFHFLGMEDFETGVGNTESAVQLTKDPAEAEYFILPLHWTCYLWNGKREMPAALEMAELADRYGKRVIIWFKGDLVPRVPFENYVLFLPGIVRSRQKKNHIPCPVFIDDPKPKFRARTTSLRPKNEVPTVGFCGYAASSSAKNVWSIINGVGLKTLEKVGAGDFEEVPILPSTFFRSRVLRKLSRSRFVAANFLVRQNYTPAKPAETNASGDKRVSEFFGNIQGTDYTVCMRGYGNWSYRFYQTLACGRIPVFVNTECVLPTGIDWKTYCIWVERDELSQIDRRILDFHESISATEFIDRQIKCRALWEHALTPRGFMSQIPQLLERSKQAAF